MSAVAKPEDDGKNVGKRPQSPSVSRAVTEARAAQERARRSGEPPPPPWTEQAKLIHNEQTKLTATLINGLALAFIVGGGVTTLTSVGALSNPSDQVLRAVVWILTGSVLHVYGRLTLGSLL